MSESLFVNPLLPNSRHFGSWVRQLRRKRGYTQTQLGLALGKTTSWVCEFEKGRRGIRSNEPQFYINLAEYMNVPLESVLSAANIPRTREDERHQAVYRMLRNKAKTGQIIGTIDALDKTADSLIVLTTDSNARIRHLCQTLQMQIVQLKTVLELV